MASAIPEGTGATGLLGAMGLATSLGISLDAIWVLLAQPRAGHVLLGLIPLTALVVTVAIAGASRWIGAAARAWSGTILATLWVWLGAGFLLSLPGLTSWLAVTIVFGLIGIGAFVLVVAAIVVEAFVRRRDALAATLVLAVAGGYLWWGAESVIWAGIEIRFRLARPAYEHAVETNTVEQHGGYIGDGLSGWIWTWELMDPAAGVVYDPNDRLDMTESGWIGYLGDGIVECRRLDSHWFWCQFG